MLTFNQTLRVDLERIAPEIMSLSDVKLSSVVGSGAILDEPAFSMGRSSGLAAFYAPFDWINEDADVVLLGVTPGKQQAEAALAALRNELRSGRTVADAMRVAKLSASFAGEMRTITTRLMDHFRMNDLFGLASASDLFGRSSHRVHYTSVWLRPADGVKGARATSGLTPGNISPLPPRRSKLAARAIVAKLMRGAEASLRKKLE